MKNEQKLHLQEMRRERLIILIDNLGVGAKAPCRGARHCR